MFICCCFLLPSFTKAEEKDYLPAWKDPQFADSFLPSIKDELLPVTDENQIFGFWRNEYRQSRRYVLITPTGLYYHHSSLLEPSRRIINEVLTAYDLKYIKLWENSLLFLAKEKGKIKRGRSGIRHYTHKRVFFLRIGIRKGYFTPWDSYDAPPIPTDGTLWFAICGKEGDKDMFSQPINAIKSFFFRDKKCNNPNTWNLYGGRILPIDPDYDFHRFNTDRADSPWSEDEMYYSDVPWILALFGEEYLRVPGYIIRERDYVH